MNSDSIKILQEALALSPENIPLRLHLADSLLDVNQLEEAEEEFKKVLSQNEENVKAKWGLVKIYYHKQNYATALVIIEDIAQELNNDTDFLLLYAKLLLKENAIAKSAEVYKKLLEINPELSDESLDAELRLTNISYNKEQENEDFIDELEKLAISIERPKISFADVGGMENVKEEIDIKIIQPLNHPELFKAYGKKTGGGILLYGPPGCGKTHIARATAGQVNAKFISVGISDILDMWIGSSEKNLHDIFESARLNSPCVLFFDEIDALGASRSDMKQSAGRHLINQFLAELDGVESSNDGLLILGATNTPWHLDSAFRRPGRFDRIIFVQPPDAESREAILKVQLKDKPTQTIDYKSIAKVAKDFSGADITAVIDIAIEEKLKSSFKSGKVELITTNDLLKAASKVNPSTKEWFVTARNYALYSNESGLYDDILKYLNIKK